jgi:predicted glycosyltransferase
MRLRKRRIALYSHDTQGLGHIRRNVAIATALVKAEPDTLILMIAGTRKAKAFALPPGADCLTLPAFGKDENGQYYSRSLAVSLNSLIELRSHTIQAALKTFEPDVLIVDKVPLGAFGELLPGLEALHAQGCTRCVLGLREVLDDPETTRREWQLAESNAAIRAYYDAVWVYGDPQVYDPVHEYGFPSDVAAKVRYTGYLDRRTISNLDISNTSSPLAYLKLPPGRLALCMVGGGQDGYHLAHTFLQIDLPPDTNGLVVTGPFMPSEARQSLHRIVASRSRQRVVEFVCQPEYLLNLTDSIIAMGGYNTVCEVLSFEKGALIVPRVTPRREQLIRVERLHNLGLLDLLHPANLEPGALTAWLARDMKTPIGIRGRVDLGGLARLPALLNEVLALRAHQLDYRDKQYRINLDDPAHPQSLFSEVLAAPSRLEDVKCVVR